MRERAYGQYCGLARAAEVLGQRWTLLVLRDLLVGPRRYSELQEGLPGIPSGGLARRLKELEADGLVVRELGTGRERAIVYRATARARELVPALDALARWGAAELREPREGEVVTTASLVSALRSAVRPRSAEPADPSRAVTVEVRVSDAIAHAVVAATAVTVAEGPAERADLVLEAGPGLRDVLAGEVDLGAAVARGDVAADGDPALFELFTSTFRVPYREQATPDA